MSNPVNLFISAHTHWDREWYKTFEVFRARFGVMMDDFLQMREKNPDYPPFTLDGQASLLADYIQIRPEKARDIQDQVKNKNLVPGPWFIQPDLFLSSDEEIVRNLQEGRHISQWLGGSLTTLYIPESGGIISQIPQIMAQFGIEHMVFIRGIGNEAVSPAYRLQGTDGTTVSATYLVNAYNNGGLLPREPKEALERIRREAENLSQYKAGPWVLINQGGDHLPAQEFLPSIIKALDESKEYGEVVTGTYDDYFDIIKELPEVKNAPILKGEVRGSRIYPALYGKITARMDLKLKASAIFNRLTRLAEPAAVLGNLSGRPYPELLLKRVWSLLLENQHHNTISGTVTDGVTEEAKLRFQKAEDLLKEEWVSFGRFLTEEDKDSGSSKGRNLTVLNTLPRKRTGPALVSVNLFRNAGDSFKITDEDGNRIPHQVVSSGSSATAEILIEARDIPGLGCRSFRAEVTDRVDATQELSPIISNGLVEAGFEPGGTFFLKDLKNRHCFNGQNLFWDEADGGDLYNFSPIPGDITLSHVLKDPLMTVAESGPLRQSLRMSGELYLPRGLEHDRRRRSGTYVSCPVSLTVSIYKDLPLAECRLVFENRATDHRLRMVFPTGINQGKMLAGQPFDLVCRDISPPAHREWIETPPGSGPFQGIAAIAGENGSLGIFSDDIREFEVIPSESGLMMGLTLLRSVGWLSRGDCITRRVTVAPHMEALGAQVQGKLSFSYALCPFTGEKDLNRVLELYQEYRNPLRGIGFHAGFGCRGLKGGIQLNPGHLVVSALRKSHEKNSIILRFYNPSDEAVQAELTSESQLKFFRKTNLSESEDGPFSPMPFSDKVKPGEIVTLELSSVIP